MSRRPTSKRNSPPNRERFVGSLIFVRGRARQTRCAHEQPRCRAGNPTIPRFPLSPSQSSRSFTAKASFHSQGPGQVTVDNGVPETRPRGHGYPMARAMKLFPVPHAPVHTVIVFLAIMPGTRKSTGGISRVWTLGISASRRIPLGVLTLSSNSTWTPALFIRSLKSGKARVTIFRGPQPR